MARSDFNLVRINHNFTENAPTITKEFPIEGIQRPIDDAYLLMQIRGVSRDTHEISINDIQLGGFDLPPAPGESQAWLLWMDRIQPGILRAGTNRITITRVGNEHFEIGNVVVNWRENG